MPDAEAGLARKFDLLAGVLDERVRRLVAAAEAEAGSQEVADHCRFRREQRSQSPSLETGITKTGGRDGIRNLGLPFAAWNQQVEQNRASLTSPCGNRSRTYPKGVKVSDKEIAAIRLERDEFHGEWNYTIIPHSD